MFYCLRPEPSVTVVHSSQCIYSWPLHCGKVGEKLLKRDWHHVIVWEVLEIHLNFMGKNVFLHRWVACGALLVALGVSAAAVGAHVVEASGDLKGANRMELAGQYSVWMGLGLMIWARFKIPHLFRWTLLIGTLVFSGFLVIKSIAPEESDAWGLGHLIPWGGGMMMLSWLGVAIWLLFTQSEIH